jgi:hypothetical protein
MKNAHLRFGRLEYTRSAGKSATKIKVHLERYVGDDAQAHLISVFGNDQEIGAIFSAISEEHDFEVIFPDETRKLVSLGCDASCYRGSLTLKGRNKSLRHLVAVSDALRGNGGGGQVILFHLDAEQRGLAWATIVSLLGLPAEPRWGGPLLESLYKDKKMRRLEGINCAPYAVTCNKADLVTRLGDMLRLGKLPFPERNGPVLWPAFSGREILSMIGRSEPDSESALDVA